MPQIKRTVGTHDGSFHADEVTACALLIVCGLVDPDQVIRTRDPAFLKTCEYVCDVGGIYDPDHKLFDHHQVSYQGPLSSAGMVLQYLKDTSKLSTQEYQLLNQSLILGVDAHDNGVEPHMPGVCTYSQIISNFMPIDHESSTEILNSAFQEALQFAVGHLKRLLERHRYIHAFQEIVKQAMSRGKDYLVFEKAIPWMDSFFALDGDLHPALFIIMPSQEFWKLRAIPPNGRDRMKVRMPLPEEWAGLLQDDLKRVSGISGAIFCHKGRFFSLWKTKDDALKALEITLRKS
jgi:uncharacterized UPF0160 family protein